MRADRRWEIDALRGLMLVLMTLTHLPTRFAAPLGQPFGYVSAAEGFVLLSAYMVGLVYSLKQRRDGEGQMQRAFLKRAGKIYLCQAALLLFLFSVVAAIGALKHQPAVTDMLGFYFEEPLTAFVSGMLLIYSPPLLDILPLYVLYMVVSPLILLHATARGWPWILGASLVLWLGAQFGLGPYVYEGVMALIGVRVPVQETGAFSVLAWQLLWVMGLWMGARQARGQLVAGPFPAWMVAFAVIYASACLIGRYAVGQTPFPDTPVLSVLFDKWELRSLRLVNLLAMVVVVMHYGPRWVARIRRLPALEVLGKASLAVFCTHLVATLLALAFVGAAVPERPLWVDLAVLAMTFAALYAVAGVSLLPARGAGKRRHGPPGPVMAPQVRPAQGDPR